MKVLFISTGDAKYGAPKSMFALMKILKEEYSIEPVLLTKKHNILNDMCKESGIENYSAYYGDIMSGSSYESSLKNMAKHIVKYGLYVLGNLAHKGVENCGINFDEIDIIHSNTNRIDIGAYLSKKYHIPHVMHLREMDEGTKDMVYYKSKWATYLNDNVEKYIAITKVVKYSWDNHGLDGEKIEVIYNGIDEKTIHDRVEREDDKLRIVAVGRVERSKGQEDLIEAVCALPKEKQEKIVIDMLGESYVEYEKKLKVILDKKNCAAEVNFCGYCSNVTERLAHYDVGMTCSTAEAFGRTTVEYMMTGLLTVASDTGANPELIIDQKSGLLYEQGNASALSQVLSDILDKKYDITSMQQEGKKRALELFSAKGNAKQIYELYKTI